MNYENILNSKIQEIKPSGIRKVNEKAMAMERAVPKLCDVNEKSYKSSHEAISLFSTVPPKSKSGF